MNEVWRLTIEIMDYKSIEALSRTNSSFRKYVNADSEYIYRKLLEREFDCIKVSCSCILITNNYQIHLLVNKK